MADNMIALLLITMPLGGLLAVWQLEGSLAPLRWGMLVLALIGLGWSVVLMLTNGYMSRDLNLLAAVGVLLICGAILWFAPTPLVIWTLFSLSTLLIVAFSLFLVFFKFTRLF